MYLIRYQHDDPAPHVASKDLAGFVWGEKLAMGGVSIWQRADIAIHNPSFSHLDLFQACHFPEG